eukprot:SAG11_NODE_1267_length_5342_cov_1.772459_7_plen_49_part_00
MAWSLASAADDWDQMPTRFTSASCYPTQNTCYTTELQSTPTTTGMERS